MKTQTIGLLVVVIVVIAGIAAYVAMQPAAPVIPTPTQTTTSTPTQTQTTTAVTKKLKVAVILPANVTDASWNMLAYQSFTRIQSTANIEFLYSEGVWSLPDAGRIAGEYARAGVDIVYFHGGQYPGTAIEAAKANPNTTFLCIGTIAPENIPKNLGVYFYDFHEPYYMLGYVGGKMSKAGKFGIVGGIKIPYMVEWINAFIAGAKVANPNMQNVASFIGTFSDPILAKEAALTQVGVGADMILWEMNEGAKGVFEAVKEKTVYTFGYMYDQNNFAPGLVLSSSVFNFDKIFTALIDKYRAGTLAGKTTTFNMVDGYMGIAPFYGLVPTAVANDVAKIQADIIAKKITVPRIAII